MTINNQTYKIKVLKSLEDKKKGLRGIKSLPKDEGVLIMDSNHCTMKGMDIDLTLVWLDDKFKIIGVEDAKIGEDLKNKKASHFIELHKEAEVKVGEQLDFPQKFKFKTGGALKFLYDR